MELIFYTVAALLLYGAADYILNTIEIRLKKRLPNRSLIFFVIISVLAISSFSIIQLIYKQPEKIQSDKAPVGKSPAPSQNLPAGAPPQTNSTQTPARE